MRVEPGFHPAETDPRQPETGTLGRDSCNQNRTICEGMPPSGIVTPGIRKRDLRAKVGALEEETGSRRPGRRRYVRQVMCGRLAVLTPALELAAVFGAAPPEAPSESVVEYRPRYNVAPTARVPTLSMGKHGLRFDFTHWGIRLLAALRAPGRLSTRGRGYPKEQTATPRLVINARAETVNTRPLFRDLVHGGRSAVLADGFFEWRVEAGAKHAYLIRRRDREPMALAALTADGPETVHGPGHEDAGSCVIVTTTANDLLRPLHHRMPVVLPRGKEGDWLRGDYGPAAQALLAPLSDSTLELVPVGTRVNRAAFDDPECIAPRGGTIRDPEDWRARPAGPTAQRSLF